ncbi:hypothetical protein ACUL41_15305 [Virgibacillus natechei]
MLIESESAIIESDYLTDTEEDINDNYYKLSGEQESVRETIANVSDITTANQPLSWSLDTDKDFVIKTITDLEEELDSFTSEGSEQISETEYLLHHIEKTINNAGAVTGDARFTDYKGTSTAVGLPVLKGYNADKREAELQEIREAKDSAIKNMDETSQAILNKTYTDLKNGEIDKDRYDKVMSVLKKSKKDLSEEELNEEVPEGFVDYLNEKRADIARDLGVPIGASMLEHKGTNKLGALIQEIKATPGPTGPNSFNMVNQKSASVASHFFKADGFVRKAGSAIGKGFIGVGFGIGMANDMFIHDKTVGEATTHNVVATGIGVGATVAAKGALTAGAVALGATPVGWAAVGIAAGATAVGVGLTVGFNYLYDNNVFGIQSGLDWAGQQIEEGWSTAKETATNFVDDVGEAFQSGLDAINLFG